MGSGADTINKGWETNDWPDLEIKEHFGKNDDRVELTLWLQKGLVESRVETRDRIKKR